MRYHALHTDTLNEELKFLSFLTLKQLESQYIVTQILNLLIYSFFTF